VPLVFKPPQGQRDEDGRENQDAHTEPTGEAATQPSEPKMSHRENAGHRRRFRAACLAASLAAGAGDASANGRYPLAQQLLVDPGDSNRLWLRATYGLLTSADGGESWDWICESAVGYRLNEDPMMGVTADGRLFVATARGLVSTPDHGCSWSVNPDIGVNDALDLAVEGDGKHVLVLRTITEPNGNYDLTVFRSDDKAERFSPLGTPISLDVLGQTIDPAPSDPARIYVTGMVWPFAPAADAGPSRPDASSVGNADGPGVLLRSRDGGATWERRPVPGASLSRPPFIAAVHPANPDVVYVRVRGENKYVGPIESTLLYTEDAGDTWEEIFRGPADMLGFSLSEDGEVRIGLGASRQPLRDVDSAALGIYAARAPSFAFERRLVGPVGCLTETATALFVCGSHFSEHFELGVSKDDGATATPVLDFGEVRGPLQCPEASATRLQCVDQWQQSACDPIGKCSKGSPTDAGVPSDAGGSRSPGANSGCGCSVPGRTASRIDTTAVGTFPKSPTVLAMTGAIGAWLARRRHRRCGPVGAG
jgi:photosystem II stability/assembly factor-like uncharacterized protein